MERGGSRGRWSVIGEIGDDFVTIFGFFILSIYISGVICMYNTVHMYFGSFTYVRYLIDGNFSFTSNLG